MRQDAQQDEARDISALKDWAAILMPSAMVRYGPGPGDLVDGHRGVEDVDRGGGDLASILGDGGDAVDAAGAGVGDEFDETAGVSVTTARGTWPAAAPAVAPCPGGEESFPGRPGRTDRGAGERHAGQMAVVDPGWRR